MVSFLFFLFSPFFLHCSVPEQHHVLHFIVCTFSTLYQVDNDHNLQCSTYSSRLIQKSHMCGGKTRIKLCFAQHTLIMPLPGATYSYSTIWFSLYSNLPTMWSTFYEEEGLREAFSIMLAGVKIKESPYVLETCWHRHQ